MQTHSQTGTILGGALLVAGTAIGGGMLALPILTGAGGFFPALVIYILCWLFMAATGLLLLEVFLWSSEEVNITSMAKMTLGRVGKAIAWLLYLFLFYSLTVAYIAGGSALVRDFFAALSWPELSHGLSALLFVGLFALFVALGAKMVDRLNSLLMVGLILSFVLFVVFTFSHVQPSLLKAANWKLAWVATPVVFTSFGFQGIVPTLTYYLNRDPYKVRAAILFGSALPLIAYVLWEGLILGILPLEMIEEAKRLDQCAVTPLRNLLATPWIFTIGQFFAFFALVTSFLGVTLGLLDFLADGFKIKKTPSGRLLLSLMVFLPPLFFALFNPCVFLNALHYAGGLGCALLLGLLPILMVWSGRYRLRYPKQSYALPGGRVTLSLLILFILCELTVMLVKIT